MGYLGKNVAVLAREQPDLARLLSASSSSARVEVQPSTGGLPTARYFPSSAGPVQLHSRHDPMKEARNVVRSAEIRDCDYVIILGFGLGYILDALVELEFLSTTVFFVVEAELDVLRAAFDARDVSQLLTMRRVWFAWPASGPELARQWAGIFDPSTARKAAAVSWPPSVSLVPEFYRSATQVIQSQISQVFTDINTLVAKSESFLENFVRNAPAILCAPGVRHMAGHFRGVPAVIVSAGPSLDLNIHELRGRDENVLILATDTSVKPLLAAGVEPHIVCTADPTYANYRHLEGARVPRALLVAEATTHPYSVRDFSGRVVACTFEDSALHALNDILGNKGNLRTWGSVATMVFDLALKAGCDPIIFVGQDLAFSDGRLYCSGVYFEDEWFADVSTPEAWRERLRQLRAGTKLLKMPDIFGNEIETSAKLVSYWNWFQKELAERPDRTFVNATEGGILTGDNVQVMSLREALFRFCSVERNLTAAIGKWFAGTTPGKREAPSAVLSRLYSDYDHVARTAAQGLRISRGLELVRGASAGARLDALKDSVYAAKNLAPIIDSFNQMGNVEFLRGRAALAREGAPPEPRAVSELYAAYFRSVLEAAEKIRNALDRIRGALADDE